MSKLCIIDECKYSSHVLCYCCKKNLCLEHFRQHHQSMIQQLNPLTDEINTLTAQLIALNIENITLHYREKLDQWRDECFMKINQFYQDKCQELERSCIKQIDSIQIEVHQIRSNISKLISEQQINEEDLKILKLNIYDIQRKILQIKEKPVDIHIHSLILDENCISLKQTEVYDLDLTKLSIPYRNLSCTDQSWPAITNNNRFLLIDQYPNILLFDQDLKIIKQILWSYGFIRSMCWSLLLDSFIIINNEKEVFLVKDQTLSIERIPIIEEQYWWCCTCSDTSLFLTNTTMGTNIFQFNLLSSFQLSKRWKPPYSCKQSEYIDDIKYNQGTLALVIKISSTNKVYFELRSSITLEKLWSLQLDVKKSWFQQTIRCCSLKYGEWLIIEGNTSHLFHIRKNGKLKIMEEYQPMPMNAVLFHSNILVVRTKENIIFHRL